MAAVLKCKLGRVNVDAQRVNENEKAIESRDRVKDFNVCACVYYTETFTDLKKNFILACRF